MACVLLCRDAGFVAPQSGTVNQGVRRVAQTTVPERYPASHRVNTSQPPPEPPRFVAPRPALQALASTVADFLGDSPIRRLGFR
jgi:hypothetical protein